MTASARLRTLVPLVLAVALAGCGSGGGDGVGADASPPPSSATEAPSSTAAAPATAPPATALPTTTTVPPTEPPAPTVPSTEPPPPVPAGALAGRTIVVDPGHNGRNGAHPEEIGRPVDAGGLTKPCNTTGTAAGDLTESAVNWDVAVRLRDLLEGAGAEVVMTRPDDEGWGPCVDERGRTATEVGADALVSVHADGAGAGARGFHVMSSPLSGDGSPALAVAVRDALVAQGLSTSTYAGAEGLVTRTDLGTLNLAGDSDAVMVECGNMANPDDLALLASEEGRQRLAVGLAAGVTAHLAAP